MVKIDVDALFLLPNITDEQSDMFQKGALILKAYRVGNRICRRVRLIWHSYIRGIFSPRIHAFSYLPSDIWPGTVKQGQSIIAGFLTLSDTEYRNFYHTWFDIKDFFSHSSDFIHEYTDTFKWLRDLKSTGDTSARRLARRLIETWIDLRHQHRGGATVTAKRLSMWIVQYDFFGTSAGEKFKQKFFTQLQADYSYIKRKIVHNYSWNQKILLIKASLEYNIYISFETSFWELLLWQLYEGLNSNHESHSVSALFYDVQNLIDIRNALRQYERISQKSNLLFETVFNKIQKKLSQSKPILRFYRNSCGTFSSLQNKPDKEFHEWVPSLWIDIALSQIEDTSEKYEPQNILRLTAKNSVLFIDLNLGPVHKKILPSYGKNILKSIFNFDWSLEFFEIVRHHSWFLFSQVYQEVAKQPFVQFQTAKNLEVQGTLAPIADSKSFISRKLRLLDQLISCTDEIRIDDPAACCVLQFQLGPLLQFHPKNAKKNCVFFELKGRRTKKKSYILFIVETQSEFALKVIQEDQGPLLTLYYQVDQTSKIIWSFQRL